MKFKHFVIFCVAISLFYSVGFHQRAFGFSGSLPVGGDLAANAHLDKMGDEALSRGDLAAAKSDYSGALKAAPWEEKAIIGLARCEAAAGNYSTSIGYYQQELAEVDPNIDLYTEFALVLQKAGKIQDAIKYYNGALDISVKGYGVLLMETYPADFQADGSDYNAKEMTAVIHIIRALNTGYDRPDRITLERQAAIDADASSPIVQYYDQILAKRAKDGFNEEALEKSLKLGGTGQNLAAPAESAN